jgi:hypothetical protein
MDRAEYQAKKQSGYEDWEVYVPPDSQTVFEKFAELIVREFSKQVQIEGRFSLEREQTLIRLCCENAKKHFGVDE